MELKKTTMLSAFVAVSGILAEIIFRDIFSKTFVGVALSIALAVVVLAAFYFAVDGVYCMAGLYRDNASQRQKEYEQRVYNVLNEQLKFQKVVYSEVKNLQQQLSEQQEKVSELSGLSENALKSLADLQETQDTPNATKEDLAQMASKMDVGFQRIVSEMSEQTGELLADWKAVQESRGASENGGQSQQLAAEARELLSADMREEAERLLADMGAQMERLSVDMKDQTDQAVSRINDHTMQAAKVIAKFVGKNTEEIKAEIHNR